MLLMVGDWLFYLWLGQTSLVLCLVLKTRSVKDDEDYRNMVGGSLTGNRENSTISLKERS
jgi:hypothetical protein